MPAGFGAVERLGHDHDLNRFDCGNHALNHWLVTWARHSDKVGSTRTYVICPAGARDVAGYYALTMASASREAAPAKLRRRLSPHHSVPLVLLARLAVDLRFKGRGLGSALMRDASLRTLQAANQVGAVAMAVHAKDDEARAFYEHWGFLPSPLQPLQLFLPLATIRQALVQAEESETESA